ncbi:hypothetical protein ACOSQ2_014112 [Xanthoceras sorbifolium]
MSGLCSIFLGAKGSLIVNGIAGGDGSRTDTGELVAEEGRDVICEGTNVCTEVVKASHQNVKGSLACTRRVRPTLTIYLYFLSAKLFCYYFDGHHSKNKGLKNIQQTWKHYKTMYLIWSSKNELVSQNGTVHLSMLL